MTFVFGVAVGVSVQKHQENEKKPPKTLKKTEVLLFTRAPNTRAPDPHEAPHG